MRREYQSSYWNYRKEMSEFDKSDYRSKFYKGKWESAWIKEIASYAVKNNMSLYEAMWLKYEDKKEHMPKSLFKFFPFNQNSIKCIETNAVFMNNPRNFNDPFDGLLCANKKEYLKKCLIVYLKNTDAIKRGILSEEEFKCLEYSRCEDTYSLNEFDSVIFHICYDSHKKEYRKGNDEINNILYESEKEFVSRLEKLRKNTVGITSFAYINVFKLTSYMELWAHYAQNHEGFCVEYDLSQPIIDDKDNAMVTGGLLPCRYNSKQIVLSKRKMYKYIKNIPFTSYEQMEFNKSIVSSFLTKSSSWKYENEWRLILPIDVCNIFHNMIPFFPIKAIYTGCRMSIDNREYIYRLALRKNIIVHNMSMHEYKYELEGNYLEEDLEKYFRDKQQDILDKLRKSNYNFWI